MKVHLTTLGCPKNQVDSELMLGMLTEAGFPLTTEPEEAECLIVNTCAFIDRAREESVNTILELARLKETGRCRALIVTGCLTQRYGGEVMGAMPEVDAILGTSGLERIVDLVRQASTRHDWATSAPPGYLYDATTPRLLTAKVPYAYVKIAEGCDMGCTFCAIPQFRGRHRSRPLGDIVAEVAALARRGVQEAILVSQDTLAWGKDRHGEGDVGDLLLALGETPMPWIRPMYLHPAHVNDRLIDKLARARIVPYLDMPVQHADDGILRAMRRAVAARRRGSSGCASPTSKATSSSAKRADLPPPRPPGHDRRHGRRRRARPDRARHRRQRGDGAPPLARPRLSARPRPGLCDRDGRRRRGVGTRRAPGRREGPGAHRHRRGGGHDPLRARAPADA